MAGTLRTRDARKSTDAEDTSLGANAPKRLGLTDRLALPIDQFATDNASYLPVKEVNTSDNMLLQPPTTATTSFIVESLRPLQPPLRKMRKTDFHLRSILGKGGSCIVYAGIHKGSNTEVAVKAVPKRNRRKHSSYRKLVHNEKNAMLRMDGLGQLASLQAFFSDRDYWYIITKYLPGGSLRCEIDRCGNLPLDQVKLYTAELMLAIITMHSRGVIHRDIKPENILIDGQGHIILADFGISKIFDENRKAPHIATSACGTPAYMSPELVKREAYSYEVDWWAMGVTVYFMLTGELPWDGVQEMVEVSILLDPVTFDPLGGFDPVAQDFVQRILQKDRLRRPTFDEMRRHDFFKDIDFHQVVNRKTQPLYVPSTPTPDISPLEEIQIPTGQRSWDIAYAIISSNFQDTAPYIASSLDVVSDSSASAISSQPSSSTDESKSKGFKRALSKLISKIRFRRKSLAKI